MDIAKFEFGKCIEETESWFYVDFNVLILHFYMWTQDFDFYYMVMTVWLITQINSLSIQLLNTFRQKKY